MSLPNINQFLKFFHCYTHQESYSKKIFADPTTPKGCRYTTLQNINLQKFGKVMDKSLESLCFY